MAHGDQEIEIKIPVSEEALDSVRKRLLEMAAPHGSSRQSDRYFTPPHRDFTEPRFPFEWLSVRRRGERALLTYKHWYPENQEVATHCDEFETEIANPDQLEKILRVLGFRELVTVDKSRETFRIEGKFEACLDRVRDLGSFVEIEAIADLGSVEETRKQLLGFAATLGLKDPRMDKRGYPYELMRKKGLIKRG